MGQGLVEATLATFQGKTWKPGGDTLTGEQVIEVYRAIAAKRTAKGWREPWAIVGDTSWSGRRINKATQLLRKAGLLKYENSLWRAVGEP